MKSLEYCDRMELSLAYTDALSSCWLANCSMDDPEVEDEYIVNRLYTSVYNMCEFLISRLGYTSPASLENRLYMVNKLYGRTMVPKECFRIVDRSAAIYRDELSVLGQMIDYWFGTVCCRYSDIVSSDVLHEFVC